MILPDDVIRECLLCLSPREERVVRLRYGLTPDGQEHTYREIGEQYGVIAERARQIEAKALRRLRHPRVSRRLREVGEVMGIFSAWRRKLPQRHYVPEWKKRNDL